MHVSSSETSHHSISRLTCGKGMCWNRSAIIPTTSTARRGPNQAVMIDSAGNSNNNNNNNKNNNNNSNNSNNNNYSNSNSNRGRAACSCSLYDLGDHPTASGYLH